MKIVQVIDIAYEAGGAEKSVRQIQGELRARGHEVLVLSSTKHTDGQEVFADELVPVISGSAPMKLLKHLWYAAAYKKIREIIRDFQPDLVHLHTIGEFSPSLLWGIGRVPTVLTVHGPEEFTKRLLPWFLPASDYKNSTYQWRDIRLVGRLRYGYFRYIQRPAYRLALRRVRLLIAPSKFMATAIGGEIPQAKIKQLYNGFKLLPAVDLPASTTILYVGRLEAVKGVDHLLQAFASVRQQLPEASLRIVGDGSQREQLEHLARDLRLGDSAVFAGWVAAEHIAKEFKRAQILVIPSIWPENFPTVAIEALSSGRPIIGTDTGGIAELVDHGRNGFIVKPGDDDALAQAMAQILSEPRTLHRAAKASISKAQQFKLHEFIEKLLATYKEILDEDTTR